MPTYYINADTGNDTTGDGSSGNPWLTHTKAYDNSASGDTVIFQDSTATYPMTTDSMSSNRTFKGESVGGAVIDAGASNPQWSVQGAGFQFELLDFTNCAYTANYESFIRKGSVGGTLEILNCRFYGNSQTGSRNGMVSYHSGAYDSTINITSCSFYNNSGADAQPVFAVWNSAVTGFVWNIHNCTFHFDNAAGAGISSMMQTPIDSVQIVNFKNCIVQNDQPVTVNMQSANNSTINMDYCCTYTTDGAINVESGTGNITTDPLFVDKGAGNYSLRTGSPCIDTGTLL